jgi:hypothetical protein
MDRDQDLFIEEYCDLGCQSIDGIGMRILADDFSQDDKMQILPFFKFGKMVRL